MVYDERNYQQLNELIECNFIRLRRVLASESQHIKESDVLFPQSGVPKVLQQAKMASLYINAD